MGARGRGGKRERERAGNSRKGGGWKTGGERKSNLARERGGKGIIWPAVALPCFFYVVNSHECSRKGP